MSLDIFKQNTIYFKLKLILYLEYAPFITFTNVNERFRVTRLRENICIYFIYGESSARAMCLNIFRFEFEFTSSSLTIH